MTGDAEDAPNRRFDERHTHHQSDRSESSTRDLLVLSVMRKVLRQQIKLTFPDLEAKAPGRSGRLVGFPSVAQADGGGELAGVGADGAAVFGQFRCGGAGEGVVSDGVAGLT